MGRERLPFMEDVDVLAVPFGCLLRRPRMAPTWPTPLDFSLAPFLADRFALPTGVGPGAQMMDEQLFADERGWHSTFCQSVDGTEFDAARWRLQLVDDVGCMGTIKRRGQHVLCRPLGLFKPMPRAPEVSACWLLASDPGSWALVDDTGFSRVKRWTGAPWARVQALGGSLDAGVAKAIALACEGRGPPLLLGFDGDVACGHQRPAPTAAERFRTLLADSVTDSAADSAVDSAASTALDFDDVVAASAADLGALARAADPVGWQREELLREECAVACAAA